MSEDDQNFKQIAMTTENHVISTAATAGGMFLHR
jgi:hypothetical protein